MNEILLSLIYLYSFDKQNLFIFNIFSLYSFDGEQHIFIVYSFDERNISISLLSYYLWFVRKTKVIYYFDCTKYMYLLDLFLLWYDSFDERNIFVSLLSYSQRYISFRLNEIYLIFIIIDIFEWFGDERNEKIYIISIIFDIIRKRKRIKHLCYLIYCIRSRNERSILPRFNEIYWSDGSAITTFFQFDWKK